MPLYLELLMDILLVNPDPSEGMLLAMLMGTLLGMLLLVLVMVLPMVLAMP